MDATGRSALHCRQCRPGEAVTPVGVANGADGRRRSRRSGLPTADGGCQAGCSTRPRSPSASSAASAVATQAITNGAPTPLEAIAAPPTAEPAAIPATSAAVSHVKASVSLPAVTARPTSAYWHENTGAIVSPASRLHTTPSGGRTPQPNNTPGDQPL